MVLLDSKASAQLATEGFAVVDALEPGDVAVMRERWTTEFRDRTSWNGSEFYASVNEPDVGFAADRFLRQTYAVVIDALFHRSQCFYSGFVIKGPRARSLDPHLDWSLSDETVHPTFNCWIALSEVNEHRGALGVVPASHRDVLFPRSPTDRHLDWPPRYLDGRTDAFEVVRLDEGQAAIYDMRLLHMSFPNEAGENRVAVAFAVADELDAAATQTLLRSYLGEETPGCRAPGAT